MWTGYLPIGVVSNLLEGTVASAAPIAEDLAGGGERTHGRSRRATPTHPSPLEGEGEGGGRGCDAETL